MWDKGVKEWDLEQQSKEWFKLRTEYPFTASNSTAIKSAGAGLNSLVRNKLAERYSTAEKIRYSNQHTDRGNELEPQAKSLLELKKGIEIRQVGFVTNEKYKYAGCSPDGIADEILIELKAPSDEVYIEYLLNNDKLKKQYENQVQHQLMITEKEKALLVAYNPNFKQSMIIIEIERDEKIIEEIKMGLGKAEKLWEEKINKLDKILK